MSVVVNKSSIRFFFFDIYIDEIIIKKLNSKIFITINNFLITSEEYTYKLVRKKFTLKNLSSKFNIRIDKNLQNRKLYLYIKINDIKL